MKWISKIFLSYRFVVAMLFVLGTSAGIATFIENDYGTQSAKVLIYSSRWYEVVMLLLVISLMSIMYKTKMWRRKGAFVFHLGFVFILIGASLTRYFGYEGVIHIRENTSEHKMITEKAYLQIISDDEKIFYPLELTKLGSNNFTLKDKIFNKDIEISFIDYKYTKKSGAAESLVVNVKYNGIDKDIEINGGHGGIEMPLTVDFNDITLYFSWGSKLVDLPFEIKLLDFQLERYPGSMSASSYASEIELIDGETVVPYRIYMNHPLTYNGMKFFQSSYDEDERGTILEINKDPGKWPTYFGYLLLAMGFLLNLFTKGSRFSRLKKFLIKSNLSILIALAAISSTPIQADRLDVYMDKFRLNTASHTKKFEALLVQDANGRIKPMSTASIDFMHRITSKDTLYNMSATQIMIGALADPAAWNHIKLVKIKNKKIKKIIGVEDSRQYVSFEEMFDASKNYKLQSYVAKANATGPSKRGTFEKDLLKFDERMNIYYMATQGVFFKIIPLPNDVNKKWASPHEILKTGISDKNITNAIFAYMDSVLNGIDKDEWKVADENLDKFKHIQEQYASDILPSETRVNMEIFFNNVKIFPKLISYYMILGIVMLLFAFASIFSGRDFKSARKIFLLLLALGFVLHTAGLGMRWWISTHAPWSDTYESLVYVGWSGILAGLMVFRRSLLALAASSMLGGIVMLVAHLSFISPQITNLVPVLKSYWLSIHVSLITASYGFVGLGFMLGIIALVLMSLKNQKNTDRLNTQIRQITAINEMSIIVGLSLLTVGNFIGGVWANESWGRYWGWDSKETWAYVSIIVYTIVIHIRFIPRLNTVYAYSIASVVSFATIGMTYFGVNFYLSGMHSYASGDKVPVPSVVYYLVLAVALITLTAYRGRDVKVVK